MGWVKQHQIEVEARGYSDIGKEACLDCLGEGPGPRIKAQLTLADGTCAYCEEEKEVFEVEELVGLMVPCIHGEWEPLYEAQIPYDKEEGRFFGNRYEMTTEDLLYQEGFECRRRELLQDICDAIEGEPWCERDPMETRESEALKYSWEAKIEYCHRDSDDLTRAVFVPNEFGWNVGNQISSFSEEGVPRIVHLNNHIVFWIEGQRRFASH